MKMIIFLLAVFLIFSCNLNITPEPEDTEDPTEVTPLETETETELESGNLTYEDYGLQPLTRDDELTLQVFDFENTLVSNSGWDNWHKIFDITNYSSNSKVGNYSLSNGVHWIRLEEDWRDDSLAIGAWVQPNHTESGISIRLTSGYGDILAVALQYDSNGLYFELYTIKRDPTFLPDGSSSILRIKNCYPDNDAFGNPIDIFGDSVGTWYYISVGYNRTTDTAFMTVNDRVTYSNPIGGWINEGGKGHVDYFYNFAFPEFYIGAPAETSLLLDEFVIHYREIDPNEFINHYLGVNPW